MNRNQGNMNDKYRIEVYLTRPMSHDRSVECYNIDPYYANSFQPIFETDCAISVIFGDIMYEKAQRQREDRKKIASDIAERITEGIMENLKKSDKMNGYPV